MSGVSEVGAFTPIALIQHWEPIATVPKGEDVLVFCPDAREPKIIIAALLTFVSLTDETDTSEDWHDVWAETDLDVEPTHWMPLPAIPSGL